MFGAIPKGKGHMFESCRVRHSAKSTPGHAAGTSG
jgi:hypothetical protein